MCDRPRAHTHVSPFVNLTSALESELFESFALFFFSSRVCKREWLETVLEKGLFLCMHAGFSFFIFCIFPNKSDLYILYHTSKNTHTHEITFPLQFKKVYILALSAKCVCFSRFSLFLYYKNIKQTFCNALSSLSCCYHRHLVVLFSFICFVRFSSSQNFFQKMCRKLLFFPFGLRYKHL